VADYANYRVRVVAATSGTFYGVAMTAGDIYTVAGNGTFGYAGDGGPASSSELGGAEGVALDKLGNLVVADTNNNRIRVAAATSGTFYGVAMTAGDIYTVAGNGTAGYSGDGGQATAAELNSPYDVAVDSSGNLVVADTSNSRIRVITGTRAPDPPTDLVATSGSGSASVAFSAPANDGGSPITEYTASCGSSHGGASGSNGGSGSPIVVSGLTDGDTYTCTVTATNAVGTGAASAASNSFVPATVPDAPTIGTVTLVGSTASVPFTAPANDGGSPITGYTATCASSNFGTTRSGSHDSSPVAVASLSAAKTYTCTVTATNGVGASAPSTASNAVTAANVPGAPANAKALSSSTTTATGGLKVSFTAPLSNGGSPITGYSTTCTSSDGGTTRMGSGAASPLTVASATTGRSYTCKVTATNAVGSGVASVASPAVIVGSPAPPTNVVAKSGSTTTSTGSLTVTFTIGANNGSAIQSQTATCTSTNSGVTKSATHTGAAAAPIVVSVVSTAKNYTCKVTARNARGIGLASAASGPVIVGSPAPPTAVVATKIASGTLRVTFTIGANNGSTIQSQTATCTSTNGGVTKSATHTGATAVPIDVTGLTPAKTYTCKVTAKNARGIGLASAPSAAKTA
jgi:Fibronectin type III domain/NHL repeat